MKRGSGSVAEVSRLWRRRVRSVAAMAVVAVVAAGLLVACKPKAGIVLGFGFEEVSGATVLDVSEFGHSGTLSGAQRTETGRHGKGLWFDGNDDKVDVSGSAALDLGAQMTLEAWVRPEVDTGWRTVVMKERPGGLAYALYSSSGNGRPSVWLHLNGGDRGLSGPNPLPLNQWSHLAATYDGSQVQLLVDGEVVASQPLALGSLPQASSLLRIGGNSVWGEHFQGDIDEVRVYERALSLDEIVDDRDVRVGKGKEPEVPPEAAEVGLWNGPVELGQVAVHMIYMHTGDILTFRGENAGGTDAAVWDPETGDLDPVPAPYNIFCAGHAQLADGRILMVGGHDHEGGILGSEEAAIFDPVTHTWTSIPSMSQRRWYPSATTLADGRVWSPRAV